MGIEVTIKESKFGSFKGTYKYYRRELLSVYLCDGLVRDILHTLRHLPRTLWRRVSIMYTVRYLPTYSMEQGPS